MHTPGPEQHPEVKAATLKPEQAHFVSRFREYHVVIITEPDHVSSTGAIVKGKNKTVRFKDFSLITSDPDVIEKLRNLREYGLQRDVWEKYQQDADLANRAIASVMEAIDALPPDMQEQALGKLQARFKTFDLEPRGENAGDEEQQEQ